MKGRGEQVNYDICMSAQQDVVFGDIKEKKRPSSRHRAEEEERRGQCRARRQA